MTTPALYLASQSPRRRQLLAQIGLHHAVELLLADPGEDAEALEAVADGEAPDDYVQRVTRAKLDAAWQRWQRRGRPEAPILCADTTVALDGRILGKPADDAEALATLRLLSGREHRVLTAVAALHPRAPGRVHTALSVSRVRFAEVDEAALQAYVQAGGSEGKAGAYAIQSEAAAWIPWIEGSYSGIMGLPLFETARVLQAVGVKSVSAP